MVSTVMAGAVYGIESYLVQVEVCISDGLPTFDMVGYLSNEVREAKERVKVALANSGIVVPPKRITINLSPANKRKEGTAFDLPIAVGILTSLGIIPEKESKEILVLGELGLNGEVKFVKGVLPMVMEAKEAGIKCCMIPNCNVGEAMIVEGMEVIGVSHMNEVCEYFMRKGREKTSVQKKQVLFSDVQQTGTQVLMTAEQEEKSELDFKDINGQRAVKRAVEVAAAGFHHLLMIGPPGSGKTMIAKRIPTILPPLSLEESLEVSKIYSISGLLNEKEAMITKRPFLNPHHTISEQAMAGGGRVPKPGIISLAHRGVLFLDELPEFKRNVLEIMRQPIEDKVIHIARNTGTFQYPADCMIVGAMNPCPCGYYPNPQKCSCKEYEIHRYLGKISGPLLDRMDICTEAPKVEITDLTRQMENESSEVIRGRVMEARMRQQKRYEGTKIRFNADLNPNEIREFCPLGRKEQKLMEEVFVQMNLSARAYHRTIKVARTIADLEGSEQIKEMHLLEAITYRMADSRYWG